MERRLKTDVAVVAGDSGRGTLRVSLQPDEHGRRIMKDRELTDADRDLVTVDEFLGQMQAEGMPVHYTRVPMVWREHQRCNSTSTEPRRPTGQTDSFETRRALESTA